MAGIDKLYLAYSDYLEFKKWCEEQPPIKDKYGREAKLIDYIWEMEEYTDQRAVCSLPCYLDAYVIRNCPLKAVQEEEEGHYNYFYNKTHYVVEGMYEQIKAGLVYASPARENVVWGKHFSCTKHPKRKIEKPAPFKRGSRKMRSKWTVEVLEPLDLWYHTDTDTWDYSDEFVDADGWCTNIATVSSMKALKRKLLKWKLPIGALVRVIGAWVGEDYEFVIKK